MNSGRVVDEMRTFRLSLSDDTLTLRGVGAQQSIVFTLVQQ